MFENVSKKQFFFSLLFNVPINIAVVFFLFVIYPQGNKPSICFLLSENIFLFLNSIYIFLCFICDMTLACSNKLMSFNNLMRNKICHIINPLSYFQTILVIIESNRVFSHHRYYSDFINLCKCIGHILSILTIFIDIYVAEHEIPHFSSEHILIASIILIIYEIIYGIIIFEDRSNIIFSFLKHIDTLTYIFYCFLSMILILLFYLFHIYLFKYKEKYRNNFLYIWF